MALEDGRFPLTVIYLEGPEVIHKQTVESITAWVPPVPSGCTAILEYADGTSDVFPDTKFID